MEERLSRKIGDVERRNDEETRQLLEALMPQASAPGKVERPAVEPPPVDLDEQTAKARWLEERRLEHEQSSRRRRSLVAADASKRVEEPDDASLKKEWLRRQRAEHETSMARRRSLSAVDDLKPAEVPPAKEDGDDLKKIEVSSAGFIRAYAG